MDYSTKMGVLWEKEKDGRRFMTGNITVDGVEHKIVLFTNNKRPGKNDPDFQIFPSKPRDETPAVDEGDIPF